MEVAPVAHDVLIHVQIILGIVLGLSLTRLLAGLTRFVQHPNRGHIYLIRLDPVHAAHHHAFLVV
jgi:hypothetical protein